MPSLAEVSQPMLRLAGIRINPRTNGPHRAHVEHRHYAAFDDRWAPSARSVVPAGARIAGVQLLSGREAIRLHEHARHRDRPVHRRRGHRAGAARAGRRDERARRRLRLARRQQRARLPVRADGRAARRPPEPKVPAGPNIQENYGKPGPVAHLRGHADERARRGPVRVLLDEPARAGECRDRWPHADRQAGDGRQLRRRRRTAQFVLVEKVKRPFSRLRAVERLPAGRRDLEPPRREGPQQSPTCRWATRVPINGVITGPRAYRWVPTEPATVVWVEALDEGDIKNKVPFRDRIVTLEAPFTGEPAEVAKTEFRYAGATLDRRRQHLLNESDRKTRTTRTWVLNASWGEPRKLWDRKQQDAYAEPGLTPMMRPAARAPVLAGRRLDLPDRRRRLAGRRPAVPRSPQPEDASRPSACSAATRRATRPSSALLTDDAKKLMTRYETRNEPPNYYVRDLAAGSQAARHAASRIRSRRSPAAERMFVTYKRKDGVRAVRHDLPAARLQAGPSGCRCSCGRIRASSSTPTAASQVQGSPNRFTTVSGASHLLLLTQGYAIFDDPTMPIVGPGETANDTYVEQLVASAQAAVDKAVEMGIADRDRIGVGGHSYGAFMTANLLAHSDSSAPASRGAAPTTAR